MNIGIKRLYKVRKSLIVLLVLLCFVVIVISLATYTDSSLFGFPVLVEQSRYSMLINTGLIISMLICLHSLYKVLGMIKITNQEISLRSSEKYVIARLIIKSISERYNLKIDGSKITEVRTSMIMSYLNDLDKNDFDELKNIESEDFSESLAFLINNINECQSKNATEH